MKNVETRSYGINLILRKYARFPWYLPLPAHMEHGWTALANALVSDLAAHQPLMLVFSKRRKAAWKKASKVPVEIMGAPFILYKKIHNIKQKKDAKGTVVFPGHSTYDLKSRYSIEDLCLELKTLPAKFQPVTICLFWLDYIDPNANIYRRRGFKVVSAGPKISNSLRFVKNFYSILSRHKYAASNEIGSHTVYAVDLGLPFFMVGKATVLENLAKRDVNVAKVTKQQDFLCARRAMKLFSTGPSSKITSAQKKFIVQEAGICDRLTSDQMRDCFFHYLKQDGYLIKKIIPYFFDSIVHAFLFNMPWVGWLMRWRKKLAEPKGKK
ncbi:MAG: hypothetical protein ABIJ72_04180 [bacterium]